MLIRDTPHLRDTPPASFPAQGISLDFPQMPAFIYPFYNKGSCGEVFGKNCALPWQPWEGYGQPRHILGERSSQSDRMKGQTESQSTSPLCSKPGGKRSTEESEEAPRKLFKSNDGPISLNPATNASSSTPSSPNHGNSSPHHGNSSPNHGNSSLNHGNSSPHHGNSSPNCGNNSPRQGNNSPLSSTCGSPRSDLSPPITGAFKCQRCSYTADKKSRLIEHMLSHSEDVEEPSTPHEETEMKDTSSDEIEKNHDIQLESTTSNTDDKEMSKVEKPTNTKQIKVDKDLPEERANASSHIEGEWFCEECEISFTSHDTYQAHKSFYCGLRGSKRSRRFSDGYRKKEEGVQIPQGYTLLPTMMCPSMIVPTPMVGIPTFVNTYAVPYIVPVAPPPVAHSNPVLQRKRQQEQPLDLSHKREDEDDMSDGPSTPVSALSPARVATPKLQVKESKSPENGLPKTAPKRYPPGAVHPPVLMPPGPSVFRCEDCNIVFYKRDNYTVHKEHYCAGRRSKLELPSPDSPPQHSSASRSLPTSPDSKKSSTSSSKGAASPSSVRDSTTPDEYTVQYFCIPCKIKFSSPDTLEAHQQYYCPARKVIAEQLAAQASMSRAALSPKSSSEKVICPQCHKGFNNMDDMMKHPCNQATMKIPMFCCPYCDYVAQSDSRLLDHIKAHAPTKAYRCTLCGYRGNTVRGMRMHGKTHIDAGENFTDDHMCELEEPPLIPKRLRTVTESVSINVATDMIKRSAGQLHQLQRQRSRSVSMDAGSSSVRQAPYVCEECSKVFSDTSALQAHMQLHLQEKQEFKCKSCDFVTSSKAELVGHIKLTHEHGKALDSESKKDLKNSALYTIENLINVKEEKSAVVERNNNISPVKKSMSAPAAIPVSAPIKTENQSTSPSLSPVTSPKVNGNQQLSVTNQPPEPPLIGLNTDKCNYCSQCDISFVYRNTYLAHKKYYCSSHIGERNATPAEV